jgi:hypothetical protein
LGWEKGQVPGFMGEITIADGFIIYIYGEYKVDI